MTSVGKKLANNFNKKNVKKKSETSSDSRDGNSLSVSRSNSVYRKNSFGSLSQFSKSSSLLNLSETHRDMPSTSLSPEDMQALVFDVKNFSESVSGLRDVLNNSPEISSAELRVVTHQKLVKVLAVVKEVLQKHPALHTTKVLGAAAQLIGKIKGSSYEKSEDISNLVLKVEYLAEVFGTSVTEFLVGDGDNFNTLSKTKSYETLLNEEEISHDMQMKDSDSEDVESVLMRLDDGVHIALCRAKAWSKYLKDIINYVDKRAALENEYMKNLSKLANSHRQNIVDDTLLPLQSTYCFALEQDIEAANLYQRTNSEIQSHRFVQPLNHQRSEHDKTRKSLKDKWTKELKKMHDAKTNLQKAKNTYLIRQQDYKSREQSNKQEMEQGVTSAAKMEKKKKLEEEALHKAMDAETTYKAQVEEANKLTKILERVKGDILAQVRELMHHCDQALKSVSVDYFTTRGEMTAIMPVQYKCLGEEGDKYRPGSMYKNFVKNLQMPHRARTAETYSFESYSPNGRHLERKNSLQSSGSGSSEFYLLDDSTSKPDGLSFSKQWQEAIDSDTDSLSITSEPSHDSSPAMSPQSNRYNLKHSSSNNDLSSCGNVADEMVSGDFRCYFHGVPLSRAGRSHAFRRLRAPSRCRECDNLIVSLKGAECVQCGITSHRRCLETLRFQCERNSGLAQRPPMVDSSRRGTMFGVDFATHVEETHTAVPHLILKCTQEINERGLDIKGIYRVSGVKSRVENLCQSFEDHEDTVDLSDQQPNVIANVLKLYLRQLPEPLLTFKLYQDYIVAAKMDTAQESGSSEVIDQVISLVNALPMPNQRTLSVLIDHLRKVTNNSDVNQMTATNIGIVFGPTLLRPSESTATLSSLLDTPYQTRIIELLIKHYEDIFSRLAVPCVHRDVSESTPVEILSGRADEPDGQHTACETTRQLSRPLSLDSNSRWSVPPITDDLLGELVQEEPRFQQNDKDINLPGSTCIDDNKSTPVTSAPHLRSTDNSITGSPGLRRKLLPADLKSTPPPSGPPPGGPPPGAALTDNLSTSGSLRKPTPYSPPCTNYLQNLRKQGSEECLEPMSSVSSVTITKTVGYSDQPASSKSDLTTRHTTPHSNKGVASEQVKSSSNEELSEQDRTPKYV